MDEQALDGLGDLTFGFSVSALIAGFVFGVIGLWLFRRARKEANNRLVVMALALMIYPIFVSNGVLSWAMGIILCGWSWWIHDQGRFF